jgi:hypothetical protein
MALVFELSRARTTARRLNLLDGVMQPLAALQASAAMCVLRCQCPCSWQLDFRKGEPFPSSVKLLRFQK